MAFVPEPVSEASFEVLARVPSNVGVAPAVIDAARLRQRQHPVKDISEATDLEPDVSRRIEVELVIALDERGMRGDRLLRVPFVAGGSLTLAATTAATTPPRSTSICYQDTARDFVERLPDGRLSSDRRGGFMSVRRSRPIRLAAVIAAVAALILSAFVAGALGGSDGEKLRWDIASVERTDEAFVWSPGGRASARAADQSNITLTGHGTFRTDSHGDVTGGGTWKTFDDSGNQTGSGTYKVRNLIRFAVAGGGLGAPARDNIGNTEDVRAGLAELRVVYSDGSQGVLAVSSNLEGTVDSVFSGITASKSVVSFFNREAPQDDPFVDANRTVFHVIR
jgi:hypothetical protein